MRPVNGRQASTNAEPFAIDSTTVPLLKTSQTTEVLMPYALAILMLLGLLLPSSVHARITKIVIEKREPFAGGYGFPVTGAYEKLVGKAYGEVDPKNPLNKAIVNLDKA